MTAHNGSSTTAVNDFMQSLPGRKRTPSHGDHAPPRRARSTASLHRISVDDATSRQPVRVRPDGALPINDFLQHLNREKRRSERSKAALSLVLYRVDMGNGVATKDADHFLELLHDAKRETDILGHVGDGMIAVLCPDTDEQGTQGFMRKIEDLSNGRPVEAVVATYPDHLFETLASGTRTQPAFQPFLVAEASELGHGSYPLKRGLDIVGALIAIAVLGLLMLVVALAIALTSTGPIIFKQKRLGKGGAPFTFYKFRSMVTNVDDTIHRDYVAKLITGEQIDAVADGKTPQYKMKSDPRVTRIGRFIRKTSIDELPQFFNVLKGDISIVGPRPCIPYEATHYQAWHLRRLVSVKPGITVLSKIFRSRAREHSRM